MKAVIKKIAKTFGYIAFFVVLLLTFIYFSLPMGKVQDYLVRTASKKFNADLEIASLEAAGLAGLKAEGVVFKVRPTAEELEEIHAS